MSRSPRTAITRRLGLFAFTLLAIELLDELVFGVREAAWPLIRNDLSLDYGQVGMLLGVPNLVSSVVEPFLGVLGDVWRRRVLVLGGGVVFGVALLLAALSQNFLMFLVASVMLYPASGAFVSLSQATLMDSSPSRHEQNMARWAFAGSLGVVGGTLAVYVASNFAISWRVLLVVAAGMTLLILLVALRFPFPRPQQEGDEATGLKQGLAKALLAMERGEVLRWLTLLQFSDMMLDILLGYLALYFVDVVHVKPEEAALAVTVWTVVGLAGDFLLIPLLERVRGLSYLRVSAVLELLLFPAFLLVPDVWAKFALLALLGFFNSGWYSILKARLYSSMPGQSGSVMAVSNVFGLVGSVVPVLMGFAAERLGLGAAMWLLLLGPVALIVGIPGARRMTDDK